MIVSMHLHLCSINTGCWTFCNYQFSFFYQIKLFYLLLYVFCYGIRALFVELCCVYSDQWQRRTTINLKLLDPTMAFWILLLILWVHISFIQAMDLPQSLLHRSWRVRIFRHGHVRCGELWARRTNSDSSMEAFQFRKRIIHSILRGKGATILFILGLWILFLLQLHKT